MLESNFNLLARCLKLQVQCIKKQLLGKTPAVPLLCLCFVISSGLQCSAAPAGGFRIEQESESIGRHIIEFNNSSFRISNPANQFEILYDGESKILYVVDKKKRSFCEVPLNPFPGISIYDVSNMTVGAFYEYRIKPIGPDRLEKFKTVSYLGSEKNNPAKIKSNLARLKFMMLEPRAYPSELSIVMCYINGLPKVPGIPVKIRYAVQLAPVGRLTTKSIKELKTLHFMSKPPAGWTKVKSQQDLAVGNSNLDYADIFQSREK
jgi:hypothetical protein